MRLDRRLPRSANCIMAQNYGPNYGPNRFIRSLAIEREIAFDVHVDPQPRLQLVEAACE